MNTSLYELTEQYQILLDMMYDSEVDEQTLQDTIEAIWGEIEEKADGYAKIIFSMKADIEILRAEEQRLTARRKGLEARSKYLRMFWRPICGRLERPSLRQLYFLLTFRKTAACSRWLLTD